MARVALEVQRFLPCYFVVDQDSEINAEEPLRCEAMTGLSNAQLTELVARMHTARGGEFASRGRAYTLGLFRSVAMVVSLMRKNITRTSPVRSSVSASPREPAVEPVTPADRPGAR